MVLNESFGHVVQCLQMESSLKAPILFNVSKSDRCSKAFIVSRLPSYSYREKRARKHAQPFFLSRELSDLPLCDKLGKRGRTDTLLNFASRAA